MPTQTPTIVGKPLATAQSVTGDNATNFQNGAPLVPNALVSLNYPTTSSKTSVNPTAVITSQPAEDHIAKVQTASDLADQTLSQNAQTTLNPPAQTGTDTTGTDTSTTGSGTTTTDTGTGSSIEDQINSILGDLNTADNTEAQPTDLENQETTADNQGIVIDSAQLDPTQPGTVASNISQYLTNGTFPLTANQQAQVAAVVNQFSGAMQTAQTYASNLLAGMTASNANGMSEYSPGIAASNMATAVNAGLNRIGIINNRMLTTQNKLSQSLQDGDYKAATEYATQLNDDMKLKTTELDSINKDIQTRTTQMHTDAYQNATLAVKALVDDNTMALDQKKLAIQQSTLDEKTKNDALTQADNAERTKIDEDKEQIADATFNATYGTFVNADGTPNTSIDPTKISGYTAMPDGTAVIDASKLPSAIAKQDSIGGIKIVSAADMKKVQVVSTLRNQVTKLQSEFTALKLNTNVLPGLGGGTKPDAVSVTQYNNDVAAFNNQITKLSGTADYSALKGMTLPTVGAFTGNFNDSATPILSGLGDIQEGITGLTPPPFGKVFTDVTSAQQFLDTTQPGEYEKIYNEVASETGKNPPDSGDVMQVINGQ